MSEEPKKMSFLESLKKTILNTDKEEPVVNPSLFDDAPPKAMSVKSVQAPTDEVPQYKFKGVSNAADIEVRFAENFVDSGGKFIFVDNVQELFQFLSSLKAENNWNHIFSIDGDFSKLMTKYEFQIGEEEYELQKSDAAVTLCYSLSSDEGVIVLSPEEATSRRLSTFPDVHIIIAFKDQLKPNIDKAIWGFRESYGDRLPSVLELYHEKPVARTNHRILLSAEGPKNVYLFYIDKEIG